MTTKRQMIGVFLLLLILISGVFYVKYGPSLEWPTPPPATVTNTITPPPPVGEAVVTGTTGCYDWSNKILVEIETYEQVKVLGRNEDDSWYMVRVPGLIPACWVKSDKLKLSDFNWEELSVIVEPFPPLFTPPMFPTDTPTSTLTFTVTRTIFIGQSTFTYTPTKTPRTRTPTATPTHTGTPDPSTPTHTPTSTSTPTDTFTPTNTPTPTPTRTPTNTPTPTSTWTPTNTPTPTPTPCVRPAAPNLTLDARGQSKNVELTWNLVPGATSYELFRSENGGSYSSLGRTNKTSMKDTLPGNGTYMYYVVAINSCEKSDHSNVQSVTR